LNQKSIKMKKDTFLIAITMVFFLGIINPIKAQVSEDSELFIALKTNDSLLFNIGFNKCVLNEFKNLTTDDLEFYHDKNGILKSKAEFINVMANGICHKDNLYKARRELVKGSLKVYPLYENGKLYGAIQNGEHQFYETFQGNEKAGSVAMFSHLWILENNQWKIKRILSFDHQ